MKILLFTDSIIASLAEIGRSLMSGVPKMLVALSIFVIGWLVAKLVKKVIRKILQKLRVDEFGEKLNEIEMVSKAKLNIKLSEVFSKIVYYLLLLFVLVASYPKSHCSLAGAYHWTSGRRSHQKPGPDSFIVIGHSIGKNYRKCSLLFFIYQCAGKCPDPG